MVKIRRAASMPFSVEQIYNLVNDVASYPQFLPWCADSEVLQQTDKEMLASLTIQKGRFQQTFTTRNKLDMPRSITMQLSAGSLSKLHGEWHFSKLNAYTCRVSFALEFAFNNRLIAMTLTPLFRHVANTMINAFAKRAVEIYGDEGRSCLRITR